MAEKIWVVDDEDSVRGVLAAMLGRLGYEVRAFQNGEVVLDEYTSERPDVVITDVQMPGINGVDLTRELLEKDPKAIVLVMTGFPSYSVAVEAVKAGAADFISKPCQFEEIRIRLTRALQERAFERRIRRGRLITWLLIGTLPVWFLLGALLAYFGVP